MFRVLFRNLDFMAPHQGKIFGKRKHSKLVNFGKARPKANADGVSRIHSNGIRSGEQISRPGESGPRFGGPSSLVPAQEWLDTEFERRLDQQQAILSKYNSTALGGARIAPFAMLPSEVWQSECASFLSGTCKYFAVDPWNTALLPEDDVAADFLGLPKHPAGYPRGYLESSINSVQQIARRYQDIYFSIQERIQSGDASALCEHADAIRDSQTKVYAYAHTLFSILFGEDAYRQHNSIFGKLLNHTAL